MLCRRIYSTESNSFCSFLSVKLCFFCVGGFGTRDLFSHSCWLVTKPPRIAALEMGLLLGLSCDSVKGTQPRMQHSLVYSLLLLLFGILSFVVSTGVILMVHVQRD